MPPSSAVTCSNSLFTPDKVFFIASADGLGVERGFNVGVITALLLSSVNGTGGHDDGTGGYNSRKLTVIKGTSSRT